MRRTAQVPMAALGVDGFVAARALNHTMRDVEGVYNRYDCFENRRNALARWAMLLDTTSKGQAFNVVGVRQKNSGSREGPGALSDPTVVLARRAARARSLPRAGSNSGCVGGDVSYRKASFPAPGGRRSSKSRRRVPSPGRRPPPPRATFRCRTHPCVMAFRMGFESCTGACPRAATWSTFAPWFARQRPEFWKTGQGSSGSPRKKHRASPPSA